MTGGGGGGGSATSFLFGVTLIRRGATHVRALGVCNVVGIAVAANRYFLLDVNLHVMNFSCIHVRVGQCFLTRDANHFGQAVIRCHVENLLGKTESVRQTQILMN